MFKLGGWILGAALMLQAGSVLAEIPLTGATPIPAAAEATVRAAMLKVVPTGHIEQISVAPIPGFYQVIVLRDGDTARLVYVSTDGKVLIDGELVDIPNRANLSDAGWAKFRKGILDSLPASERIVYAPAHPKYTIKVFTDVTCPYCRALHGDIEALNKEGIAVEYLAWPREGLVGDNGLPTATYVAMVSIWCAANRNASFSAAVQGKEPKSATCKNPVKDQYALGLRLGLRGTPAIYAEDGTLLDSYLPPAELLKFVQEHTVSAPSR